MARFPKVDLTGRTFGLLTVLGQNEKSDKWGHIVWNVKCICGRETTAITSGLNGGTHLSCGCQKLSPARNKKVSIAMTKLWAKRKANANG